ncbi:hypothetical protein SBF1_6460002 [Candidatus Desulfosporosinus infrequens]|uniref:Uncharacterized protein n=1 Tax=Candidatus Desulfosporosinus infrequens TaxID=2043169 RepID=A0A2U3LMZ3_9FIRM|nr:hypothetical protein SBF1_6460002 [Candidatus Desulfosporosinus infrequens]
MRNLVDGSPCAVKAARTVRARYKTVENRIRREWHNNNR